MVGSQIGNLTPSLCFGHNLCFKCPNGSFEPILDIKFQNIFNDIMNSLIQWVLSLAIAKMGIHLGVWGFIPSQFPKLSGAWNVTHGLHFWPAPLQALALVASPRLRLQHLRYVDWRFKILLKLNLDPGYAIGLLLNWNFELRLGLLSFLNKYKSLSFINISFLTGQVSKFWWNWIWI
jgi:hypothetical protein